MSGIKVLILVLMEDTLRGYTAYKDEQGKFCLNPCFNGRYSQREKRQRSNCRGS